MATPKDLKNLLRHFGYTPTAGQSFRNNIPGAANTYGMTDYRLYSWDTWSSSYTGSALTSGSTISFEMNFQAGRKWAEYMRIASPTGMAAHPLGDTDPVFSAEVVGGVWEGGSSGRSTCIVKLTGRAKYGSYSGGSGTLTLVRNYYKFYTSPDRPLGTADEEWEIIMSMNVGTYAPPANVPDSDHLIIEYPDDQFNDTLTFDAGVVSVYGYDAGPNPIATPHLEWHSNSSFTNLVSTDQSFSFMVGASNPSGSLWLRSRMASTDSWTNYPSNPITWHDPRFP